MNSRHLFTEAEKDCLIDLIVKYKLHTKIYLGQTEAKTTAWLNLAREFNLNECTTRRSVKQLKKCWGNLIARRKVVLRSRDNMRDIRNRQSTDNYNIEVLNEEDGEFQVLQSDYDDSESTLHFIKDEDMAKDDIVKEEYGLVQENYKKTWEREEELHKLKLEETQWQMKVAEEVYQKALIEKEAAHELLLFNTAKRKLAELELEIAMKREKEK